MFAAQIEQKMAAKIMEEEEKRMFFEMNEQSRIQSMQRCVPYILCLIIYLIAQSHYDEEVVHACSNAIVIFSHVHFLLSRDVDDQRKKVELRENTVKILDQQVRAVNQRKADEAAARRQEIQGKTVRFIARLCFKASHV